MTATAREMTDDEVLAALDAAGLSVVMMERPTTGDLLADLFLSADEMAARAGMMAGARAALAALPAGIRPARRNPPRQPCGRAGDPANANSQEESTAL